MEEISLRQVLHFVKTDPLNFPIVKLVWNSWNLSRWFNLRFSICHVVLASFFHNSKLVLPLAYSWRLPTSNVTIVLHAYSLAASIVGWDFTPFVGVHLTLVLYFSVSIVPLPSLSLSPQPLLSGEAAGLSQAFLSSSIRQSHWFFTSGIIIFYSFFDLYDFIVF